MNRVLKAAFAAVTCMAASISANEPIDLGWQAPDWAWEPTQQTFGHRATQGFDPVARELRQIDLFFELQDLQPSLRTTPGFSISLSQQDMIDIGQAAGESSESLRNERRYLVGVNRPVNSRVNFNRSVLRSARGREMAHQQGLLAKRNKGFVWGAPVRSEGATAVRVMLTGVDLADGAELYVYNELGQAFGPYSGKGPFADGEFWSDTMAGSTISIQLHGSEVAMAGSGFTIAEVAHIGPRFRAAGGLVPEPFATSTDPSCTTASCVVDGSCASSQDWGNIEMARDSVAQIIFSERGGTYICSGGLIADNDPDTEEPLFLTANHCLSQRKVARSVNTYFQFRTSGCGNCNDENRVSGPSGATILATSSTSDYTLMRLSGSPPSVASYAGISNTDIAYQNGQRLYRISHPEGAAQSYSEHVVDTSKGVCGSWPRGNWIYSKDDIGATQGGSSGSPVFNEAGQVVGQLSGGCGTNVGEDCDSENNATVDGALAAYYDDIAEFLGSAACTPETEVCDGADNDCDGLVDEGGVCDGGGNDGLPSGASCKRDSQCASRSCSGRGKNRACD